MVNIMKKTKLQNLKPNYFNSIEEWDYTGDQIDVTFPFNGEYCKDCEAIFKSILKFYKTLKDNGSLPRNEKTGELVYFEKYSILDKVFERSFECILPSQSASSFYSDFFTKLPEFVNELCKITFDKDLDDNTHFLFYVGTRIIKNLENASRNWGYSGFGPHSNTCRCVFCYHENTPGYISERSRYEDYVGTSNWIKQIKEKTLDFTNDKEI